MWEMLEIAKELYPTAVESYLVYPQANKTLKIARRHDSVHFVHGVVYRNIPSV